MSESPSPRNRYRRALWIPSLSGLVLGPIVAVSAHALGLSPKGSAAVATSVVGVSLVFVWSHTILRAAQSTRERGARPSDGSTDLKSLVIIVTLPLSVLAAANLLLTHRGEVRLASSVILIMSLCGAAAIARMSKRDC